MPHTRVIQGFPEKAQVVGGAAAATGLGDEQRCFVEVIFPAFERIHHLADDEQRRIAGVVMDAFEPLLDDAAVVCF